MILIVGNASDPVTALVLARLTESGLAWHILDPDAVTEAPSVHAEWHGGRLVGGWFAGPGWRVDIGAISGAFVRFASAPGPDAHQRAVALHAERITLIATVLDDLPCPVANRLLGGISNHSKPHQAQLIRASGLAVPETLVTDDPAAARAFIADHGGAVIYKSLSGLRSIVRRVGPGQQARLDLLRHGPAQFQAQVSGIDLRVHVVGTEIFTTKIESESVDYRYATKEGVSVTMLPATLPNSVAEACLRLARRLELLFAGIDLKLTPEGAHVCFEANPAPAFIAYELTTGQPISAALTRLLSS